MTKYNAAKLIKNLDNKGFTSNNGLSDFVINQKREPVLPLYLRLMVGVGAFIASLCFIFFLYAFRIISFEYTEVMVVWGVLFVACAIGLQRISCRDNVVKHSFFTQSSFVLMVIGKILFVLGISEILNSGSGWGITLGLLVITAIAYHIYRMSIDRFLSSFAVLLSILINILWDRYFSGSRELLFNGFFLLQFISAAILLTYGKIKCDYIPLSYAFVFSLCASVLFLASQATFGYWGHEKELIHPAFINAMLTGGLIVLFAWVAGGIEKLKKTSLVLASIVAMLLGLISAPGILLTIGLMVLGYAKHEKLLIIIGALLMPVFLFVYYYNVDLSFLYKSGVLIGSGIVLLAGRFYIKYKGWDKGDVSCEQK